MPYRYKVHDNMDCPFKDIIGWWSGVENVYADDSEQLRLCRAQLAREDLYYLLVRVLGRYDMQHEWLYKRCREVQKNPDGYLDLWAREHYKSTIITYGHTILDIINNPEITIGIFSHTKDIAEEFLNSIKTTLETNVVLKSLFPDTFYSRPKVQSSMWEKSGIIVKRTQVRKEPTVSAHGLVDGMPTGFHLDIRLYDDIVTEKSVGNPNQINKTTDCWALSTNLGTEGGVARYVGTYYHLQDTYHVMQERGIQARVYPCTSDGTDNLSKAVLKSQEYLATKKKEQGVYIFSCQMLLNPLADSVQGFKDDWWQTWGASHHNNLNKVIVVDPSSGRRGKTGNADNDYTSMWVLGKGGDDNWYVIDVVRDRMRLTKRAEVLMELHRTYRPRKVGYEEYGMQSDIEYIETVMAQENYRFKITPLGGQLSKQDRIKRLVPLFENGRIYMPTSLVKVDWENKAVDLVRIFREQEYSIFPVLKHDDMLDALSRICDEDMFIPSPTPKEKGWDAYAEIRRQQRMRRPVV